MYDRIRITYDYNTFADPARDAVWQMFMHSFKTLSNKKGWLAPEVMCKP